MKLYAPILLFVYKRPEHTWKTLSALEKNLLSENSPLFIFSDGPRSEEDLPLIKEVRKIIRQKWKFKELHLLERETNMGLAFSIVSGVSEILTLYDRVIVLEDDIVTSPTFLLYMNQALLLYEEKEKAMHITGYMFPINTKGLPDLFFLKPATSWGWGTWKRAWKHFRRDPQELVKIFTPEMIRSFNLENTHNYWEQVVRNLRKETVTWAIFWYASVFLAGGLCLHPRESLVQNIGMDGTGENCVKTQAFLSPLSQKSSWEFPPEVEEHPLATERLKEFYRKLEGGYVRKFLRKVKRWVTSTIS